MSDHEPGVEVERSTGAGPSDVDQATHITRELRGFGERLVFALGPLGAGLVLDVLDFATFGPLGLVLGGVVGGCAGWVLGGYERVEPPLRIAIALGAAAYMTIPFTEPIPAATILVLLGRFFSGPRRDGSSGEDVNLGSTPDSPFGEP